MTQTEIERANDPHEGLRRGITVAGLSVLSTATAVLVVIAFLR